MVFLFLDNNYKGKYNDSMRNLLVANRIAFSIGDRDIYWYGVIMCVAIITAILVAMFLCKKKQLNTEIPLNIALIVVPAGIIGARFFACLFDAGLTLSDFLNFRTGGMSIFGAIVFGGLALIVYVLLKKEEQSLIYFDILCSVLILSQAIGRWGNYFNEELYGMVIAPYSVFATFPFAVMIDGVYYQALFFYEFVANLIGFLIISKIFLKSKKHGLATSVYLIYYGTVRAILEPLRQSKFMLYYSNIAVSSLLSYVMIAAGIILLIAIIVYNGKRRKYDKKV